MPAFYRNQVNTLIDYLYYSHIHDARIKNFQYDFLNRTAIIETHNPIFNIKIKLTFNEVKELILVAGNEVGSCDTILSLTVEDECSPFPNGIYMRVRDIDNLIYLVFQMFSGDELHIISKGVCIES